MKYHSGNYYLRRVTLIIFFLSVFALPFYGEGIPDTSSSSQISNPPKKSVETNDDQPQNPQRANPGTKSFLTPEEKEITMVFLGFAVIVLIITSVLMYKFSSDSNVSFKYFIIVLLVLGMLIMIPVGYDHNQLSPAVGLFGTIAGYLLGRSDNPAPKDS